MAPDDFDAPLDFTEDVDTEQAFVADSSTAMDFTPDEDTTFTFDPLAFDLLGLSPVPGYHVIADAEGHPIWAPDTGDTGATGARGPRGYPGYPGTDGQDGERGPPGPAGSDGATGATGAQGPQGVMGPPGATGEQGEPGSMGPRGLRGLTGLTGPQGSAAPAGMHMMTPVMEVSIPSIPPFPGEGASYRWSNTHRFIGSIKVGADSAPAVPLDVTGNARVSGYVSAGTGSAPSNVTAGDVTGLRGHFGTDAAFTAPTGGLTATFENNVGIAHFGGARTFTAVLEHVITLGGTVTGSGLAYGGLHLAPTLNGAGESPRALSIRVTFAPSGNINDCYGGVLSMFAAPPTTKTIATATGFYGGVAGAAGAGGNGAITNAIAIHADGAYLVNGGPTPTNMIGLKVTAAGNGTNNYDMAFTTVDTTAAGAYYGRIPVLYNGLKKYIHVFSA